MLRNTASQKIALFAFEPATGAAKTGDAANLTAYVSISGGAVTVLGDTSATEMSSTNAPGWYLFDLTQAETNGEDLLFTAKSSTGGVSVVGRPVTTTLLTGDAYARLGAPAGASVSADIADLPTNAELATALAAADDAVLVQVALVKAQTDNLPADPADASDIVAAFATTDAAIAALSIPTAIQNADALLNRDMATGSDSGSPTVRTVRQALRFLRNKWSLSGTTLTVTKEDDATASWTAVVTATAGADPITGNDPAGP